MKNPRRRAWGLVLLVVLGPLVHALAARALIDHGVAGALLAGGGGASTVIAAAGFLLLRLVGFLAWASLPAALLAALYSPGFIWKIRGGSGSPSK